MASLRRLWNVLRRARMDEELRQEVETHLALLEEEERANGSSVEQARDAARSRFGNPVSYREQALDGVVARWLENAWQDARFAVRQLRKAPGFTIPVVLSLALGIGANTAIFTLIDAVLLKSLPLADPAGLVLLGDARSSGVGSGVVGSFPVYSHDLYEHLQETDVFDRLCAVQSSSQARVSVRHAGSSVPQPAASKLVSGNYFEVLGVKAAMGRTIAPSDDSPAAPPVAVVSFRYWQERLNGDPSAIGSAVDLNGVSVAIIGVAPPEFYGETLRSDPPSFWLPISADRHLDPQRSVIDAPDQHWLYLMGRLKPNVSVAQGQSRLTAALQSWLFAREGSTISDRRRQGIASSHVELTPGGSGVRHMQRSYAQTLRLLLGISAAVLLITCANIANLLLARSAARRAESSLRLALGASRGRLLRQSLTESLTLALAGGALALLAAQAVTQLLLFLVFGAEYVPIRTAPDVRVFAFTFALSGLAAIVFGLLPAMRMSSETAPAIKTTSRGVKGSALAHRGWGLGTALIIGEVAISLVLLAGAGSLARSLANLSGQGFGFDREQVLVVDIDPALARYDYSRLGPLYQQMTRSRERVARRQERELVALQPVQRLLLGVQCPGDGLHAAAARKHAHDVESGLAALFRDARHEGPARPCLGRTRHAGVAACRGRERSVRRPLLRQRGPDRPPLRHRQRRRHARRYRDRRRRREREVR